MTDYSTRRNDVKFYFEKNKKNVRIISYGSFLQILQDNASNSVNNAGGNNVGGNNTVLENIKNGDDRIIGINRESTRGQSSHHAAKVSDLCRKIQQCGVSAPSIETFTGNGSIRLLQDFFTREVILRISLLRKSNYFVWLYYLLFSWLRVTRGTLYVFVPNQSRLFRSANFDRHDKSTWTNTSADYGLFNNWLNLLFGESLDRIVFVILQSGTGITDRGV